MDLKMEVYIINAFPGNSENIILFTESNNG